MKLQRIILLLVAFLLIPSFAQAACDRQVRLYAAATTLDFCLYTYDSSQVNDNNKMTMKVDATFAAGDVKVDKDEAGDNNIGTLPTDRGDCYSVPLTGTELTASRVYITIKDQGTKTWVDHCVIIDTYGDPAAQHVVPNVNVSTVSNSAITANSIATDAITATKIAADSIGASEIAADAIGNSELADTLTVGITGNITGNVSGSVGSVTGNVAGSVASVATGGIGVASFAAGAIDSNAIANNAITANKIATNAIGDDEVADTLTVDINGDLTGAVGSVVGGCGGGGGGGVCTSIAAGAINQASFGTDVMRHGTAQSVGGNTIRLASSESFLDNQLNDDYSVIITDSSIGKWEGDCICKNTAANDMVTLCHPWTVVPTGTVKYRIEYTPNCNKANWP